MLFMVLIRESTRVPNTIIRSFSDIFTHSLDYTYYTLLCKLFVAMPLVAGALATSMRPRSSKTDLTLYAYGSEGSAGIGGYLIVFKDGKYGVVCLIKR
jgi:hypothetical protein